MTFAGVVMVLVIGGLVIAFYLLPCIIAYLRDTEHATAILVLNLLFGWTVLGWIALVIWAAVEKPAPPAPASAAAFFGYRARRSSTMPSERKAAVFKCGLLTGLVLIGLAVFVYTREAMSPFSSERIVTYAREFMSPLTPEKIVQAERRKAELPMDIDAITRWESIEAGPQRVIYTYTVRRSPRDRDGLANALRQQITQSVCGDKVYRDAVKQNISFEFVYKFTDESYPAITLSPGECAG